MKRKADLPEKTCPVCQRPYSMEEKMADELGPADLLFRAVS